MMRILVVLAAALTTAAGAGGCVKSPPKLFKRNAELKAQGYYMAEFEFKMEAALYHLNEGSYWQAYRTLRRISYEMETLEGLVKVPQQASSEELTAFLLGRQNAETGAFMDSHYPFFTFIGPTANVLDQLESLAAKTGKPIQLKYPLRFIEQIRTPEQLRSYLDSLLYFKERWAKKFGGPTPYCPGVSELSYETLKSFERFGGFEFSEGWWDALNQWYYAAQDPKTGFWGARIGDKDKWSQALDIDSTSHILAHFLGDRGEARDAKYPLRYAEPLALTLLTEASTPIPEDAVGQHEWNLRQAHAAKIVTRWLWPTLSEPLREQTLAGMSKWLETRFAMYRPNEGGFAVDSSSPAADIDATTTALSFLGNIGFIPGTWQRERLRGMSTTSQPPIARFLLGRWEDAALPSSLEVNSIRVYADNAPATDSWDDSTLVQIIYPRETQIPDIMDLRQGLVRYASAAGGEFGNWTTKASLKDSPLALDRTAKLIPVVKGSLNLAPLAGHRSEKRRFFVVGVDRFQVPIFRHEYFLAEKA
jgi:hypothetical protein